MFSHRWKLKSVMVKFFRLQTYEKCWLITVDFYCGKTENQLHHMASAQFGKKKMETEVHTPYHGFTVSEKNIEYCTLFRPLPRYFGCFYKLKDSSYL